MIISVDDPGISYYGRWIVGTQAVVISSGGRVRFRFTGTSLGLNVVLSAEAQQSQISWSIDGGVFSRSVVSASMSLATGLISGTHTVEIFCEGVYFGVDSTRWTTGDGLRISGYVLDDGESVASWAIIGPARALFLGDSITEALKAGANNEAVTYIEGRRSWANQLSDSKSLIPYVVAFGSTGVTKTGRGGVPTAVDNYPYKMDGVAEGDPPFDLVFIFHGHNDGAADATTFKAAYRALLDLIHVDQPSAIVFCIGPLSLATEHRANVQAVTQEPAYWYAVYIDPSAWSVGYTDAVHPTVTGHASIAAYVGTAIAAYLPAADTHYIMPALADGKEISIKKTRLDGAADRIATVYDGAEAYTYKLVDGSPVQVSTPLKIGAFPGD